MKRKKKSDKKLSAKELKQEILKLFRQNPRKRLNPRQVAMLLGVENNKDSVQYALEKLAEENRFKYSHVYIRNQMTKWGNCSAKKNISLNWRLVRAPQYVVDYIILHELLHTETMNHSQQFWIRLRSIMPDYQSAISWLEKYGSSIIWFC